MQNYYKAGLTNTGFRVREEINKAIDRLYDKKQKRKK